MINTSLSNSPSLAYSQIKLWQWEHVTYQNPRRPVNANTVETECGRLAMH